MNLQQFEKLLRQHLPPRKVRKVIRIYLGIAGEEISLEPGLTRQFPDNQRLN